jgi:hypothetical protein
MRWNWRFVAAGILVCLPAIGRGQTADSLGRISGVAIDSINGGYLKGAFVYVSGTVRSGITDSVGRFAIDSIPAGSRVIDLQHQLLDMLGVKVVTPQWEFAAGKPLFAILSTPAPDKIIDLKCSADERRDGLGALLGSVTDPDTSLPVADALVTLDWVDIDMDRQGLTRKPRHASARSRSNGSFRICGLPEEFTANLQASAGVDSTATVGVTFRPRLAIVSMTLGRSTPTTAQSDSTQKGRAILRGRVVNSKGQGLSGARVSVDDREPLAITDDDGRFALSHLPSGTRLLNVRRIGFEPTEQIVRLSSSHEEAITVVLNAPVQTLETVRVTALSRVGLSARGFFERQKNAKGDFFDPDYLAKRNPSRLAEVLVRLPYVMEVPNPRIHGTTTIAVRIQRFGDCIEYVVDGHPWLTPLTGDRGTPNEWIRGGEIAAVEAYRPGQAPPEIQKMTLQGGVCSTFVIWTKWKMGAK